MINFRSTIRNALIITVAVPIDFLFLIESTIRLHRHGYPWLDAFRYSQNR